jgi:hypothetical protein
MIIRNLKHQVAFVYTLFLLWLWALPISTTLNAAQPLPIDHPRLQITPEQPYPVIFHIGAVDRNILALEIEAQRTQRSTVQTYTPLPGDRTKVNKQDGIVKSVELIRRGKPVAYLAG